MMKLSKCSNDKINHSLQWAFFYRTWVSCELPHFGQEQSIFVSARQKSETSIAFNIGIYLLTSFFCMSCPVRTIIRRKTKVKKYHISYSFYTIFKRCLKSPIKYEFVNYSHSHLFYFVTSNWNKLYCKTSSSL